MTWLIGALAIVGAAVWSFMPQPAMELPIHKLNSHPLKPSSEPAHDERPIDPAVFAVKLWNPPPSPPSELATQATAEAPPKPLNLQLIGIINEPGLAARAAVYDIDSDRLLIVGNGDHIRDQVITAITPQGIELSDGHAAHRLLLLRQEPSS